MERTYAEVTLAQAIVVLGDVDAPDDDREDAARVVQAVLLRACPTETALADLFSTLGRALRVHLAVRRVLGEVQRLRPDTVVERAGYAVERLMAQACQDGDHESLAELVLIAMEHTLWARLLRDEWGKPAVTWAISRLPESKYPAALLVGGWLRAHAKVPSWLRDLVDHHPDLVTSDALPLATRWQLHTTAPTVAGWHHLAGSRRVPAALEPTLFADQLDVAVATLEQAHGEAADETKRLALQGWLRELTGRTP